MDPVFASEYNKLLNSMDDIRRRINATREIDLNDPERKGCVSSDHQALDQCHQRLRAMYLERLREAVHNRASSELATVPRDLARSSETSPSPDVCDKMERQLASALRGSSLDDNDRRRVARGASLERAVSWKGNIEAVCIIPSRLDADAQRSVFTKRGFVGKLRKLRRKLLLTTTTIRNVKARSESSAAASLSDAKSAMGDSRVC